MKIKFRKFNPELAFRLFRSKQYLKAALLKQLINLVTTFLLLVLVINHFGNDASLIIRYGKPLIVIIGLATCIQSIYSDFTLYKHRVQILHLRRSTRLLNEKLHNCL
jgi:membrane-associated phospholipid phosphatase